MLVTGAAVSLRIRSSASAGFSTGWLVTDQMFRGFVRVVPTECIEGSFLRAYATGMNLAASDVCKLFHHAYQAVT
jgi:hypothetical protein